MQVLDKNTVRHHTSGEFCLLILQQMFFILCIEFGHRKFSVFVTIRSGERVFDLVTELGHSCGLISKLDGTE